MPSGVRRLLHRAVDLVADSGNAGRQGRRSPLRESGPGVPLPDLSVAGASGGVRFAAGDSRNVRFLPGRGAGDPDGTGTADRAGRKRNG